MYLSVFNQSNVSNNFLSNKNSINFKGGSTSSANEPVLQIIKEVDKDGFKHILKGNVLIKSIRRYFEVVDADPLCMTGKSGSKTVIRSQYVTYHDNGKPKFESYHDGFILREFDQDGNVIMIKEGSRPAIKYDNNGNPIKPYPNCDVAEYEKAVNNMIDYYNRYAATHFVK